MTLIKSRDAKARSLAFEMTPKPEPAPHAAEVELASVRAELARLTVALERANTQAAAAARVHAATLRSAEAEARRLGEADGRRAADQAAVALQVGLTAANEAVAQRIGGLEALAAALAEAALARVLDDPSDPATLVREILRRQFRALDAASVLEAEVSEEDFPDPDSLQALGGALDRRQLRLSATRELPPGGCRLRLTLGGLDIGLGQQWGALRAVLTELADEGAAR